MLPSTRRPPPGQLHRAEPYDFPQLPATRLQLRFSPTDSFPFRLPFRSRTAVGHFPRHPQLRQQHCQLSGHGNHCTFLLLFPPRRHSSRPHRRNRQSGARGPGIHFAACTSMRRKKPSPGFVIPSCGELSPDWLCFGCRPR